MKIQKILLALTAVSLIPINLAWAHCPTPVKEEKVCLMYNADLLYIYDQKSEHNGPYKDFVKAEIKAIKSFTGEKVDYKKIARGIYKMNTPQPSGIKLEISLDSGKTSREIMVNK